MSQVPELVLYTTVGCHLCEQAEELLDVLQQEYRFLISSVDISSDEKLVDLYGIRIPVVKNRADGREIGWPFTIEQLQDLL